MIIPFIWLRTTFCPPAGCSYLLPNEQIISMSDFLNSR